MGADMTSKNLKWAQTFCDMLHKRLCNELDMKFAILLADEYSEIPAWQKWNGKTAIAQVEYWVLKSGVSVRFQGDNIPNVNIYENDLEGALNRVVERTKQLIEQRL